tara:strand:+ start:5181 stop:5789 length:609 start_codon:yes stop_codon:yes gene_type:complete
MSPYNGHLPLSEIHKRLNRRIKIFYGHIEQSLSYGLDHLFHDRVDEYLQFESKVEDVLRVINIIVDELEISNDMSILRRIETRLDYIEDQFDELDSKVRGRRRRRRRQPSLFDFFHKTTGEEGGKLNEMRSEINSLSEAYEILGLMPGTSQREITTTFRNKIRDLHPDTRGGDRSAEPLLRKLIEAYQFLKAEYKVHPATFK